jgi:hypothetical protein
MINFGKKELCIYEDCHFLSQGMERTHIGDLLSGTEFEPTEFQKIILEGMNPIWRYLVISEFRKKHRNIIGDMRFDINNRIPINFRPRKWIITQQQVKTVPEYIDVNRVQNETKIIEEKLETFDQNYDEIIDYLFGNWLVVQNLSDKVSMETALKISIYAIYYMYKLKDIELMETIVKEQSNRKWNGFILITRFYTMNKYSKTGLQTFKAKWADDNVKELIKEEDAILKDTNEEIGNLFFLMKRKCGDYL